MGDNRTTRIQICGRLAVELCGRELTPRLPGGQARVLFTYLTVTRALPSSRGQLIEALWPYRQPAGADSALSALLSRLRSALAYADRVFPTAIRLVRLVRPGERYDEFLSQECLGDEVREVSLLDGSPKEALLAYVRKVRREVGPGEVLNVMRRLARETDMTMLLVTHEMSFAHDFADRVLFFDGGRIIEEGPPDQIFTRPRQERTQAFLKKILAAGHRL